VASFKVCPPVQCTDLVVVAAVAAAAAAAAPCKLPSWPSGVQGVALARVA